MCGTLFGADLFLTVYEHIKSVELDDQFDDDAFESALMAIVGENKMCYIGKVHQLLHCENRLSDLSTRQGTEAISRR